MAKRSDSPAVSGDKYLAARFFAVLKRGKGMKEEYFESKEDCTEVKEVLKMATDLLSEFVPDVEDILTYLGYVYERQGFRNGCRYEAERRCCA